MSRADSQSAPEAGFTLNLLAESAPLASAWAGRYCGNDPDAPDCAVYHGLRQYWRILDLVTTPAHHAFYPDHIRTLCAEAGSLDVLISGTADYAQLAQILEVCRGVPIEPRITVVDRCRTPLALCRWYADRVGVLIETHCSDIREYQSNREFDLIATHSFLTWFPPVERRRVTAKWYELLRPGGVALTVNRIRPPSANPDALVHGDDGESDEFCAQVLERAQRLHHLLDITPEELAARAKQYRAVKTTYGLRSLSALEQDFRRAGFAVETTALGPLSRQEWRRERDKQGNIAYIGMMATRPD